MSCFAYERRLLTACTCQHLTKCFLGACADAVTAAAGRRIARACGRWIHAARGALAAALGRPDAGHARLRQPGPGHGARVPVGGRATVWRPAVPGLHAGGVRSCFEGLALACTDPAQTQCPSHSFLQRIRFAQAAITYSCAVWSLLSHAVPAFNIAFDSDSRANACAHLSRQNEIAATFMELVCA